MLDLIILGWSDLGGVAIQQQSSEPGDDTGGTGTGEEGGPGGSQNVSVSVVGTGDRSGLDVRFYAVDTGALLLELTTLADGTAAGTLDYTGAFSLLITDPTNNHAPAASGPYRVTAT